MYRLPNDVQRRLRNKFPHISELDEIVNSVFEEIIEKTLNDGSCTVYRLGLFYSYKAFSKKRGTYVPRLKFQISRTLLNRMIDDEYVMQRITKVMDRVFDKEKETNPEYLRTRNLNYQNQTGVLNNQKEVRRKTQIKAVEDEISKILSE